MNDLKHTQGKFSDGYTGWKIDNRVTNDNVGFEIQYSDDGECITDHVYTIHDAKLIAAAPELLKACNKFIEIYKEHDMRPEDECCELYVIINNAVKKATE